MTRHTSGEMRINKAIALAGLASRREADHLILQGEVRVNGERVTEPGMMLQPGAHRLEVSGRPVAWEAQREPAVWALYKPKQHVSTLKDPEGRPSIADLLPRGQGRLFPIGRLDYDAEGLILLTNDGELAQRIGHPSYQVEKVYLVKLKGVLTPEAVNNLRAGPVLDGRRRQGMRVEILHSRNDKTWVEATLREGIQHHIKKAFAGVGHRVLKIKRYRIGPVELGEMRPGEVRRLGKPEISWIMARRPKPGKIAPDQLQSEKSRPRRKRIHKSTLELP